MIRNESLGPNYGFAVVSFLIAIVLIVYDGFTRKRLDYVWSFIAGTIMHAAIEFVYLNADSVEYLEGSLFGRFIPEWLSIILRCSQEGGVMLVIAMFEGDRVFDCLKGKQKRPLAWRRWTEFLIVFVAHSLMSFWSVYQNHQEKLDYGSVDVCSRRLVTEMSLVAVSMIISLFSLFMLLLWRKKRYVLRRSIGILLFTTWISVFLYCSEYNNNIRWIEVGSYPEVVFMPSKGQALLAYLYSITIETVLPMLCIYQLMVLTFVLSDLSKDGYFSLPVGKEMVLSVKSSISL